MIYLTTGANGAGKTLITLKDVREQQLKENRPVFFNGFDMDEATQQEFGWTHFPDPRKWMELPEGSICLFDECQEHFGKGRDVPQYILDLAKYRRKRGLDMWLITPHPTMLHVDVRRLIEKPSWHRHVKRSLGAQMVSVIKFPAADLKCEEPGSGERGEISMRPYPKEVYQWYRSTSLNTAKVQIPKKIYLLAAIILAVPTLMYFAVEGVRSNVVKHVPETAATASRETPTARNSAAPPLSPEQYVDARTPRLAGLAQTAPAYDSITTPVRAPYPAACVASAARCNCYTVDATRLSVPDAMCRELVERGFFADWLPSPLSGDKTGGPDRPPVGHPEGVGGGGMGLQGPMSTSQTPTAPSEAPQGAAARPKPSA